MSIAPAMTPELARELQQRSVLARKQNQELRKLAALGASVANAKPAIDPYIDDLVHAQTEYLAKLRACKDPKEAAALSQALKNIRETYHMATGLPKPGVLKPASNRPRQSPAHESPDAPDSPS